jgi:hypothetical protein
LPRSMPRVAITAGEEDRDMDRAPCVARSPTAYRQAGQEHDRTIPLDENGGLCDPALASTRSHAASKHGRLFVRGRTDDGSIHQTCLTSWKLTRAGTEAGTWVQTPRAVQPCCTRSSGGSSTHDPKAAKTVLADTTSSAFGSGRWEQCSHGDGSGTADCNCCHQCVPGS